MRLSIAQPSSTNIWIHSRPPLKKLPPLSSSERIVCPPRVTTRSWAETPAEMNQPLSAGRSSVISRRTNPLSPACT